MANKIRYFVRIDSKGVPVPASNQNRSKKPVANGRWLEFEGLDCCGQELTLAEDDITTEGSDPTLTILCSDSAVITLVLSGDYANVYELVGILNSQAGYLGYFSVVDDGIVFQVKSDVVDATCSGDNLTFEIS